MPSLAETQGRFRAALAGAADPLLLAGLRAPARLADRLDIYRRHHRESFRRHLRGRYPTVEWLTGTERFVALADRTLQYAPPRAPSLAAYGAELIAVIRDAPDLPPYLPDVAEADWRLGALAVAIALPPLPLAALAAVDPGLLATCRLSLQPGLAYLDSGWPVDELVHLRLAESQPDSFAFAPRPTRLQLSGARGRFALSRLAPGAFAFRSQLAAGEGLAAAAQSAVQADPQFDFPAALAALFAEHLVIAHTGENAHD